MIDVVVIGGGLAGSAIAAELAKAGRNVTLLERDVFPRDKLCGELLSTEVRGYFERLGVRERIEGAMPHEIRRARFVAATGRSMEVELNGTALGLSRRTLDAILFDYAKESGARCETGVEAQAIIERSDRAIVETSHGSLEANLVVAAHGRRSRLDKTLRRAFTETRHPYAAIKKHYRVKRASLEAELAGWVEINAFNGGYCGFCFVEGGVVNACALVDTTRADVREIEQASEPIARRFRDLSPIEDTAQAVAEIPFVDKETSRGRIFYCGDAAGMIAPLAGDGQAMAIASAGSLAKILLAAERTPNKDQLKAIARAWDRTARSEHGARMKLGRALQSILFSPRATDVALRALKVVPPLARSLVKLTRG